MSKMPFTQSHEDTKLSRSPECYLGNGMREGKPLRNERNHQRVFKLETSVSLVDKIRCSPSSVGMGS